VAVVVAMITTFVVVEEVVVVAGVGEVLGALVMAVSEAVVVGEIEVEAVALITK